MLPTCFVSIVCCCHSVIHISSAHSARWLLRPVEIIFIMTKIQKRPRPTRSFCTGLREARMWIFGTGLFLLFGTIMLQTSEDFASNNHSSSALLRTNTASEPVIQTHGALSCLDVKQKLATGECSDPNRGRIYARETISLPPL